MTCEFDTDGDGNCGRPTCPTCHPEHQPVMPHVHRPIHGYGSKPDGSFLLMIGLTPEDFVEAIKHPIHLPLDARFHPVTDVLLFTALSRAEIREQLTKALEQTNIVIVVEGPSGVRVPLADAYPKVKP